MIDSFIYQVDGKDYEVQIRYKRIRNIYFHFDGEKFWVSAKRLTSLNKIKSGLDKFAKKLISTNLKTQAEGDSFVYVFGEKKELVESHEILVDETIIKYKNIANLKKQLKVLFLDYVNKQNAYYSSLMNAPSYQVKVRQMKTRYGSNNRSKKIITYSTALIHYSKEIIDSVIMHEICHCFVFNHSRSFYNILYKYCPNYKILRKKLIQAEFK